MIGVGTITARSFAIITGFLQHTNAILLYYSLTIVRKFNKG